MNENASFARKKFHGLIGVSMISVGVWFLLLLADTMVVGNLVGSDGIAGIGAVIPVLTFGSFLSTLICCGAEYQFVRYIGAFRKDRASEIVGMATMAAIAVGVALAVGMMAFRDAYFDWAGLTGSIRMQAVAYWKWKTIAVGLMPVVYLLEHMVYADVDETVIMVGNLLDIGLNITLSVLLVRKFGTAEGAALGSLLATIACVLVECTHFLRKSNAVRFKPYFSFRDFAGMIAKSLTDSSVYACWALALAILNAFIAAHFGEKHLVLATLAFQAIELSIVFDGLGEAYVPIGGMYAGEGNFPALRSLVSHYWKVSVVVGIMVGAAIFLFPQAVLFLFGIDDPVLVDCGIRMLRRLALVMPLMSLLLMATSHYLIMDYVVLPVVVTVAKDFVAISAFPVLFGLLFGLDAMWLGFPAGYAVTGVLMFAFLRLSNRREWPWLIPVDDGTIFNRSFRTDSARQIVSVRDQVDGFLAALGVDDSVRVKAMLLVEELTMLAREKNGRKSVTAEISVMRKPTDVRLVIRDTGRILDDQSVEELVDSFRGQFVVSVMRSNVRHQYQTTVSCNRREFYLPITARMQEGDRR